MRKKLTQKQEMFAQGIAAGKSQAQAYRDAYPVALKWGENSVNVQACNMAKHPNILLRISELKNELKERTLWSMEEAHKILKTSMIKAFQDGDTAMVYKGVELLNKLHGIEPPSKVDITTGGAPIAPIVYYYSDED